MQSQKHVSGMHLKAVRIVKLQSNVSGSSYMFSHEPEKLVALHAIDWQSFSYSKHKEHTNSSTHNLQAPRFTFSILIQKSAAKKSWGQRSSSFDGVPSCGISSVIIGGFCLMVSPWRLWKHTGGLKLIHATKRCWSCGWYTWPRKIKMRPPQDFGPPLP